MNRITLVAAVVLVFFTNNEAQSSWVYNANSAFVANELLPSPPPNSFGGFTAGYMSSGGVFTAFTSSLHTDSWGGNSNLQGWAMPSFDIVPAVVVNTSASQTSFGTLSPIDSHQIVLHEGFVGGSLHDAVLRFTAVNTGLATIVGDWESLDSQGAPTYGRTLNYIRKNGVVLSTISETGSFSLSTFLNTGDTIDFVVNADNDTYAYDSTGLRATITQVPEPMSFAIWG